MYRPVQSRRRSDVPVCAPNSATRHPNPPFLPQLPAPDVHIIRFSIPKLSVVCLPTACSLEERLSDQQTD
ncbi:hypothetical protein XA68_16947 [Ophiocordyceps unilateralis]|uniref:Uncharacterized protein n=1 Tax=Ophiocordyceps unilateralis TaxID=268505 RepID=A0A2A9PL21_OPHUN|nr:hypothetical protein XA68_16947 [Ophiocordyceps unilateralis]